jgi:hypothetical protein
MVRLLHHLRRTKPTRGLSFSGLPTAAITDGENTWHFTAWPKAFKQIKAFVQQSREASSEPELAALKRRAIFQVVLGSVVFLGGIALTLDKPILKGVFEG